MDRRIKDYLYTENNHSTPYTNHYGHSNTIGCGDINGCGRAFTKARRSDNYDGKGILSFNGKKTHIVDDYVVCISNIRGVWAKAEIINNDFTTQSCYIGKLNNHIVIANSIRDIIEDIRVKIFNSQDNEIDIAKAFVTAHPDYEAEYDWEEMVEWHSLDRTSCMDGRRKFSMIANKEAGSKATPKELISYMKNTTSRRIAEKMEEYYLNSL